MRICPMGMSPIGIYPTGMCAIEICHQLRHTQRSGGMVCREEWCCRTPWGAFGHASLLTQGASRRETAD